MPGLQTQTACTRDDPGMTGCIRRVTHGLLLSLLLLHGSASLGDERADNEYRIKAAFLYNFSSFTSWPEMALQDNAQFRLCVVGHDPFDGALDSLSGKKVNGIPLKVSRLAAGENMQSCQLAFISESETGRIEETLGGLTGKPVLTVSDIDDFTLHGGIIRLKLVDNKVRFDINVDAAEQAGLKISSKLLSRATIIREEKVTAR